MKTPKKALAGCVLLFAVSAKSAPITSIYDDDVLPETPDDIMFDLDVWEDRFQTVDIYDPVTGAPNSKMEGLLNTIFEGIECSACLAAASAAGNVIEDVANSKKRQKKEMFGSKYASEFDTGFQLKMESMCFKIGDIYRKSVDGHFRLMNALKSMELYAGAEDANMIDFNDNGLVPEVAGDMYEAFLSIAGGYQDYFTPDVNEQYEVPYGEEESFMEKDWRVHAEKVLQEWCHRVKDSDALDDAVTDYYDELPRSAQQRICQDLEICKDKIKRTGRYQDAKAARVPIRQSEFEKKWKNKEKKRQAQEERIKKSEQAEAQRMEQEFRERRKEEKIRLRAKKKKKNDERKAKIKDAEKQKAAFAKDVQGGFKSEL
mmetsp:Transcript_36275/g.43810  ORF Transcript_36275/g.43810 Transcript_36275/m.43810 type:complete len:373 (-) Transcript_36275:867-1985(-)|eukprot:CAMPEP_0197847542 /NCGR_PEP_ID=MMETSP1438-20131217/6374_1 /TAXON_ID=1461541 /ORGANISM="Pterosperma sp., Strain CCMP1384" /LENGTH=372 /DNA_ID=CAMNT_0043459493 /DNA_START=60 /DNA_END=1178 /DNA_ORIENTATION=-